MSDRKIYTDATWLDGLRSLPRGPRGAWAFITFDHEASGVCEVAATANAAELEAICRAVEWSDTLEKVNSVWVRSDSLAALTMARKASAPHADREDIAALQRRIHQVVSRKAKAYQFRWSGRETPGIQRCDELARIARERDPR